MTENQAAALTFAAIEGHISSREAIDCGFGPATCGILENRGLLRGAGRSKDEGQLYEITDEGRKWLECNPHC